MKLINLLLIICLVMFATNTSAEEDVNLTLDVNFDSDLPESGNLILGIYENGELGSFGARLDNLTDGGLSHILAVTTFTGKTNELKVVTAPKDSGLDEILLLGLGDKDKALSAVGWQNLAGNALQHAINTFKVAPPLALDTSPENLAFAALGAKLGSYYFDKYQTSAEKQKRQASITLLNNDYRRAQQLYRNQLDSVAKGIWYARNVANEPGNIIYPESFVSRWREHFRGMENIRIRVLDEDEMRDNGMGAILGVGQGSKRPPKMMIVEYRGAGRSEAPVLIAGKGITFDTGGISLKNPTNMWNMRFDMSGAASTMGTIYALAGRKARVNAVGIAALAENMPGAEAQRPGDVVTSMSGKTIQIRSTDAEGRLVLADAVYYGDQTYDPALIVDLATLTGSARRALGSDYGALFTRDNNLAINMLKAGIKSGDEVWHLPLNDNHFKAIENDVADVMNSGPTAPGASAGAAFIGTFIRETTPWVHFDIAGVAWYDALTPIKSQPGASGFGVRLLNTYIKENFEQ